VEFGRIRGTEGQGGRNTKRRSKKIHEKRKEHESKHEDTAVLRKLRQRGGTDGSGRESLLLEADKGRAWKSYAR